MPGFNTRQRWRFASLAVLLLAVATANAAEPKRVLLLYTEEGTIPAVVLIESGVLNVINQDFGSSVELYREHLDATQPPPMLEESIGSIRHHYSGRKIDLIICIGFIETSGMPTNLFPDVPAVYLGAWPDPSFQRQLNAKSVIVWDQPDYRKTLEVARRLQPKVRKVLVFSGSAPRDKVIEAMVREQFDRLQEQYDIEYVSALSIQQLKERVDTVSSDTILLPLSILRDGTGANFNGTDVVRLLADSAHAPMYAVGSTYVGVGAVGGYVLSYKRMGEMVAKAGLQLLDGKKPQDIVSDPSYMSYYLFDGRQLQRWGFSERDLPPGSVVENRIPSAWELYRWRIVGITALLLMESLLIIMLLVNRKHRLRAELSLKEVTAHVLDSQEEERRRIARDLHDGTGQELVGLSLSLREALTDFPAGFERVRMFVENAYRAGQKALLEVRTVSYVLHPPALERLGLVSALRWYIDGLSKRTPLRISFEAPADLSGLSADAETALFRIAQESMSNVLRHSGGTDASVTLEQHLKDVTLVIRDNGRGMNTEDLMKMEGLAYLGVGVAGMRERVRQLKGRFDIQSSEHGTTISASLPVEQKKYAARTAS